MPNLDINQLATNDFGLSASGYVGSQGPTGYLGSAGVNGTAGANGSGSNKPKITNIQVTDSSYTVLDDTAVSTTGGYIKITGAGFESGCNVLINQTTAVSVSFVSATEVRAQVPAMSAGGYIVYVVNANGGTGISVTGLQYSGTPAWTTAAGTLGNYSRQTSFTANLTATGDAPITYTVLSGSLPSGLTLNANTGVISGTTPNVSAETTYNFTVRSSDAQQQETDRAFSITVSIAVAPTTVEYLLVAGGGSGGGRHGGGGGAGGLLTASGLAVSAGVSYAVTVGAGGAGSPELVGNNGSNSTFGSLVNGSTGAVGGGGGGVYPGMTANSGGSGGGAGSASGSPAGANGTAGQGNSGGGNTYTSSNDLRSTGGGGGAGGVGVSGTPSVQGNGGPGLASSISGTSYYYAGGGGGSLYCYSGSPATSAGNGGIGGGGGGGFTNATGGYGSQAGGTGGGSAINSGSNGGVGTTTGNVNGGAGGANTGGGGGGVPQYYSTSGQTGTSGQGGSGIVIIRYADTFSAATSTTGSPTVTVAGGYRVYRWNTSGSITF